MSEAYRTVGNTGKDPGDRSTALKAFLLFLFFFLVIAAFWTLKPMRTSGVVKAFGPKYYPVFKQGILLVAPVLTLLFTYLSGRLSREKLVYSFAAGFTVLSWVFWGLYQFAPGPITDGAFYFFVDSYITVMVVVFFTYLNDVYTSAEAKKFYGAIGLGGLLGGVAGAGISGWASEIMGPHIILCVSFFLGAVCLTVRGLQPLTPVRVVDRSSGNKKSSGHELTEGFRVFLSSKYLIAIAIAVGTYEIASTLVDYQFNLSADAAFAGKYELGGYLGRVAFWGNIGAVLVQLFLTTWVNQRKTILYGLMFLPVTLLLGSSVFLLFPLLAVITVTISAEATFSYSIHQTTKEILYTPLDSVARYKSKAFIDMIVVRGAKALGGLITVAYGLWLTRPNHVILMSVNLLLISAWIWATFTISRSFDQMTRQSAAESKERKTQAA